MQIMGYGPYVSSKPYFLNDKAECFNLVPFLLSRKFNLIIKFLFYLIKSLNFKINHTAPKSKLLVIIFIKKKLLIIIRNSKIDRMKRMISP